MTSAVILYIQWKIFLLDFYFRNLQFIFVTQSTEQKMLDDIYTAFEQKESDLIRKHYLEEYPNRLNELYLLMKENRGAALESVRANIGMDREEISFKYLGRVVEDILDEEIN